MTSYSCFQTNVLWKFVDIIGIFFCTHSPCFVSLHWIETIVAASGPTIWTSTDWNQCFVIDCSLSHPAGHKPFTCSHIVLRNTWLNIHAVHWMRFSARLSVHVFTTSWNLSGSLFVSSAVSELSSAWSINCFLRYVCCYIVVKDKLLFVLMVDRCCRFVSLKPAQNLR